MNLTSHEAVAFAGAFLKHEQTLAMADVTICPAAPVIPAVAQAFQNTSVKWGGQNIHWEEHGAFTGEVSVEMLADLNCHLVLCGHSERRRFFKETDFEIGRKAERAAAHGIIPVLCVGETYDERRTQKHEVVVIEQVRKCTELLTALPGQSFIVAYEPVWAIGTGQAIEPSQAWDMVRVIHNTLREGFPTSSEKIPIIYGGSVTEANVAGFVDHEIISGVLVGGASLDPEKFYQLIAKLI